MFFLAELLSLGQVLHWSRAGPVMIERGDARSLHVGIRELGNPGSTEWLSYRDGR